MICENEDCKFCTYRVQRRCLSHDKERFIRRVFEMCEREHPQACYGMWTYLYGKWLAFYRSFQQNKLSDLLVSCQGCGYIMRINPQTGQLEHLENKEVALSKIIGNLENEMD